ncbi:MAG: thymidylate synthase [Helicobacteraceae bacterium]|nr:thymidylate synthase [Helicobacteraceae bacterium]
MKIEFLQTEKPSNVAVSAGRTCYFPNGIVAPEKSEGWARKDDLLKAMFKGGHHTTLMHTNITMLISDMSRHLIWRLLHSHTFYNSEQVSQRYAKMKIESFVYPKGCDTKAWQNYYESCFKGYEELCEVLEDDVKAVTPKFRQKDVKKKAQEMARYVLPGGMSAYLYHSVNIITLLRYIAVAQNLEECGAEAKEFADIISEKLLELDSSLAPLIDHAKNSTVKQHKFDMNSIKEKHNIKTNDRVKVFDVVGEIDFEVDENYADVLRYSQMLHDGGVLGGFSTYIKHSLSSDAQNQRHRRSPAVRPLIEQNYSRDFYTPPIIAKNEKALKIYNNIMKNSYDFFEKQKEKLGFGEAIYAITNAHNIELVERNDFSSYIHKTQMRLCYNAQQEVYDIVYEQSKQLRDMNIKGSENLLPPCAIRNSLGIRPICPEGDHFCGVKVWKLDFNEYKREM